jgi:hypothetical protein
VFRQDPDADLPRCNADDEGENDRSLTALDIKPDRSTGTRCQIECQLIQLNAGRIEQKVDDDELLSRPLNHKPAFYPPQSFLCRHAAHYRAPLFSSNAGLSRSPHLPGRNKKPPELRNTPEGYRSLARPPEKQRQFRNLARRVTPDSVSPGEIEALMADLSPLVSQSRKRLSWRASKLAQETG